MVYRRDGTTTKQRDKVMMRHQVICWRSVCSSESSVGDLYAAIRSFPLYAPPSALVWSHIGMVYRRDGTTTQQHDKVMMRHEHATFSHLRYAPPSLLLYVLKLILIRIPIVVPPPPADGSEQPGRGASDRGVVRRADQGMYPIAYSAIMRN
jgi:hypothetical protein